MEFPVHIGIGNYFIQAHLLFELLGYFIGFRYYLFFRKGYTDVISSENRVWILIGAAFGAFFFSRLLGGLENPSLIRESKNALIYFYQNKTIVGGLLGGLLGVELIKKVIGEKHSSGDLFVFPLILAMIIGRIGCFLNGVYEPTFGIETASIFGMDLGDGLRRHPVALYEIIFLIGLWISLNQLKSKGLKSGLLFKYFMISYLIFRFLIEYIKPSYILPIGLSSIQIACLIGIIYYSQTLYFTFFNQKKLMQ
jgi:prolipoprotein diacylglyceryltransferase